MHLRPSASLKVGLVLLVFSALRDFPPAAADTVTIETQSTVTVKGSLLGIDVKVSNKGDVAAYNLQPSVHILNERLKESVAPLLPPGGSKDFHFEKKISGIRKGRYPLTVFMEYYDAGGHPFSAVSCMSFHQEQDFNPDLVCLAEDASMSDNGRLRYRIKNTGEEIKGIQSTLILPRELSLTRPPAPFGMKPGEEKTLVYDIANFSAIPGSTYTVFAAYEYESEEVHHTAICRALVRIEKNRNWFQKTQGYWLGVSIFLALLLVLYQFKRR
jgi:hypothetical protein